MLLQKSTAKWCYIFPSGLTIVLQHYLTKLKIRKYVVTPTVRISLGAVASILPLKSAPVLYS